MKIPERNAQLKWFFQQCMDILESKGKDYNPDGIAYSEVTETAQDIGISPEQVLWIAMRKHYCAIKAYIKSGKAESEPIRERLKDLANYAALLAVLIDDKKGENNENREP